MNPKKHPKTAIFLLLLLIAIGVTYSWTYTPYGRLDYKAAVSLKLLSFETRIKPHPGSDFEITLPINLIYAFSGMLPNADVAKVEDVTIPGIDRDIPARVYWPLGVDSDKPAPVIVYFHGGGFVVGSVDIFDPLTRSLADTTKAIVVSIDYRLAPEHPYPAAVDDCYEGLLWTVQNIQKLGGDPTKIIVAGDSAGGNLAAVVALKARNENGPAIAAQVLYYPVTDLTGKVYPSNQKFADGYGLSKASGEVFHQSYIGHVEDTTDPYISPLYAESLANLPPALVITAGFDPLTDGTKIYADKLGEAGGEVAYQLYPSMIHGFMSIGLFSGKTQALEVTRDFLQTTLKFQSDN